MAAIKQADKEGRKMRITIGKASYWMPEAGGYVWVEGAGRPGTLGHQACEGSGSTIRATPESFSDVVRKYHRKMLKTARLYGEY